MCPHTAAVGKSPATIDTPLAGIASDALGMHAFPFNQLCNATEVTVNAKLPREHSSKEFVISFKPGD